MPASGWMTRWSPCCFVSSTSSPVLREAICERLIELFSRRNAAVGAAIFVPGADFPAITLGQLRLVLRLAAAHGIEIDRERLPEILGVVGSGYAFRGLARQALRYLPVAGFVVRGAVAYAGTRAIGEAAVRYFSSQEGSVRPGS